MTMNPTYKDLGSKKEEEDEIKLPKMPSSSSSKQWSSSFKNPRIVRVSRNFAGKDRHSKVCTVRGLRDRRIRLSVPTAIQLYDLQERLNLTQPSKVIDWLLDATKEEIDQLPPLPIIPTNFLHFNPNPLIHHPSSSSYVSDFLSPPNLLVKEREGWTSSSIGAHNDQENGEQKNFFPLNSNHELISVPNLPYNPNYFNLEPPNLSLSHFGGGFSHNHQEHAGCSLPSSSSPPRDSSSQINYMSSTPHFPPYFAAAPSLENDHHFRQMNSSTLLHNMINSPMKSFSLDEDRDNNSS